MAKSEYKMKSNSDNGKSSRGEHSYEGHDSMKPYGSPMGKAMRGPGPVEGAGEVVTGSPGKAASRYGSTAKDQGGHENASGKTPKGMKVQLGGEEA